MIRALFFGWLFFFLLVFFFLVGPFSISFPVGTRNIWIYHIIICSGHSFGLPESDS